MSRTIRDPETGAVSTSRIKIYPLLTFGGSSGASGCRDMSFSVNNRPLALTCFILFDTSAARSTIQVSA
jgi:hypothetical protein